MAMNPKALQHLTEIRRQAKINAAANTDEQALKVPSLYPEWSEIADGSTLEAGQRVRHDGVLYKVNEGQSHKKQSDRKPGEAHSLFAKVLTSENPEEILPWEQPDSTNGYEKGAKVTHKDRIWESFFDGLNVWEPGVSGTENIWIEVNE